MWKLCLTLVHEGEGDWPAFSACTVISTEKVRDHLLDMDSCLEAAVIMVASDLELAFTRRSQQ